MSSNNAASVYGAAGVMFVFSTAAVILRFVARSRVKAGLWWDDWIILAALPIYYALTSLIVANAALWGLCWPMKSLDPVTQLIPYLKSIVPIQALYFVSNFLVKISLLLLYHRLFNPSLKWRRSVYIMGAIIIAWFTAFFIANLCTCVPLSKLWDFTIAGRCNSELVFAYGNSISNMLIDFMILCLPFPVIYHLNTDIRTRISLAAIFLLGFFVCAISIARITSVHILTHSTDITLDSCDINIWSFVEPGCSLIGTCLPTLKPLVPRFFKINLSSFSSNPKSSDQSRPGYGSSSWNKPQSNMDSSIGGKSPRLGGPYQGFERLHEKDPRMTSIPLRDMRGEVRRGPMRKEIFADVSFAKGSYSSDDEDMIEPQVARQQQKFSSV